MAASQASTINASSGFLRTDVSMAVTFARSAIWESPEAGLTGVAFSTVNAVTTFAVSI